MLYDAGVHIRIRLLSVAQITYLFEGIDLLLESLDLSLQLLDLLPLALSHLLHLVGEAGQKMLQTMHFTSGIPKGTENMAHVGLKALVNLVVNR